MNNDTAKVLQDLYVQKKEKIQELLQITQVQSSGIAGKEIELEDLERFLNQRSTLMNEVDCIDGQIKDLGAGVTLPIQSEIQAMVEQVIQLDAPLKIKLGQEMSGLKQKMKTLHGGKNLKQAYYPQQVQKFGYFIDKKK